MPYSVETYQKESFKGGPLGKRARFLPMLPMNSPKNDPPLKMGTPKLVGSVHLVNSTQSQPHVSCMQTFQFCKLLHTLEIPRQKLEGLS